MAAENPLLLTLTLDVKSQLYFNELRQLYFPPERNFLDAHLMLFHQLPTQEPTIVENIADLASRTGIIQLQISAVVSMGRGVAFKAESNELMGLHKQLQSRWQQWLIPQDKQKLWPHITVQNKVEPVAAKQLADQLFAGFEPFYAQGMSLTLWEYRGGPWAFVQQFDFNRGRT